MPRLFKVERIIRTITRSSTIQNNSIIIGIEDGFDGLIFDRHLELYIITSQVHVVASLPEKLPPIENFVTWLP